MASSCDMCAHYVYDDEDDFYECLVNMDEDDFARFVARFPAPINTIGVSSILLFIISLPFCKPE